MKRFIFLSVGFIYLFIVSCADISQELILDSFEDKINSDTVDYGAAKGSLLVVEASGEFKVCGQQSIKLQYNLKPRGYMWAARGYDLEVEGAAQWEVEPHQVEWNKYNSFSLYMYGSDSGGVIAFDIKDSGGEIWRFLLDDDFQGWKKISCPFSLFTARQDWQPQSATRNEVLDFPIMSFQFEPLMPGQGTYYFDCIKLARVKDKNVK